MHPSAPSFFQFLPYWRKLLIFSKLQGLKDTVKARDGFQNVPLMNDIGSAEFINDITLQELRTASCVIHTIAKSSTWALDGPLITHPETVSTVVPFPAVLKEGKETAAALV